METILTLGALSVTRFGLGAALALLAGLVVCGLYLRRCKQGYHAFIRLAVIALPLVWLCSRVLYLLANCTYYFVTLSNPGLMLRFWDGGYSLVGALLGMLLAAVIAAKWVRVRTGVMMDAAVLGMLPAIAVERLFERGTGLGFGRPIAYEWLLPLTVDDGMGDLVLPVYAMEAAMAALLLIVLVVWLLRRKDLPAGEAAITGLTLLSATQVVLESLRNDQHMVVHFVRIQQVVFLVVLVALFALCLHRADIKKSQQTVCWLVVLLCVGLGILMEFRVDRGEHKLLYYTVMTAALAVIAGLTLRFRRRSEPHA